MTMDIGGGLRENWAEDCAELEVAQEQEGVATGSKVAILFIDI